MASRRRLAPIEEYFTLLADSTLITAFEYDVGDKLIFMGRAEAGTPKSGDFWQIKRFTYDGSDNLIDIQWAQGNGKFDKQWDDRSTYEYK